MNHGMPFQLEVCVDRIDHAIGAAEAGATRIEMNSALECDGLTPSLASVKWLVEHCPVPVVAMLRPHNASFEYTRHEKQVMIRDAELLLESGAAGIVAGALEYGQPDLPLVKKLAAVTAGREFVFHRAFDQVNDQFTGLRGLVDSGVTRVLTSGGKATAREGSQRLRELIEVADNEIEILPAAGIRLRNIQELVSTTGCTQVHGSFRCLNEPSNGPDVGEIAAVRQFLHLYR